MNKPRMRQLNNGQWHCRWGMYNSIMPTPEQAYSDLVDFTRKCGAGFRP